jgi:isopentenyl-diphosphate Delta-isomerase
MIDEVILVDEQDNELGSMEKMEAHRKALLHRAFSVFLFNAKGEMLLQQRAAGKYHSPLLWSNTCCSHPRPSEAVEDAATRRLQEELGFTASLTKAFSFVYKTQFDNGLTEHEYDHVFTGVYEGHIEPNKYEVAMVTYKSMDEIASNMESHPEKYTSWFKIAFPKLQEYFSLQLQD